MPIATIAPPAGPADAPRSPRQPITGKVFALRDGSGYAALASDGNYYRVDVGHGHGLTFSRAGGCVDAAMVDVDHGPVKSVQPDQDPGADPGAAHPTGVESIGHRGDGIDVTLSGNIPRGLPAPQHALKDIRHAAATSREARTLIVQEPGAAVDSQANLSPQSVQSLLG